MFGYISIQLNLEKNMSDEDTTRIVKRSSVIADETLVTSPMASTTTTIKSDDDPHTKIFRPSKQSASTGDAVAAATSDFAAEPVVGWLVVVDGPGRGQSLKLGFGMNSVGRDVDERVSLNFGDEEVSRKSHTLVTFDPKGRKFYLQHGGGINLTYIDDQPILQTHELKGREIISIGNTRLCFIPFCGSDFMW